METLICLAINIIVIPLWLSFSAKYFLIVKISYHLNVGQAKASAADRQLIG